MELENEFTFQNVDIRHKCFDVFRRFRSQKKFCDVTFNIGTQSISAHRVVVAAAMPFFQETLSTEKDEFIMPDVDPNVFERLVDFAYSCELKITMENVRDLLSGARQLQMDEVREACCDFLAERLRPENALNFRELAAELHYPQLMEITDGYIKERFTEVYQTERFLSCPFSYIKELTGKEDLYVDSEEKVLEAVLRWVKASSNDRKMYLPDLLQQVRMPLMTPLYLTEVVEREELIRSSAVNRDLLDEAKNYNLFPQKRKSMCNFSTEPRLSTKVCSASSQNESAGICKLTVQFHRKAQYFDFRQNAWLTGENQSYHAFGYCSVGLNKKMYFFYWGYALVYNPENNEYKLLRNPSMPRIYSGAASLKNKIYICGGRTDFSSVSNGVECFDPETNRWTEVKSMRVPRWSHGAVTVGDYIYVFGGRDHLYVHSSVERYPSVTGGWTTMAPMLTKRSNHSSCVLNGKIYACGGGRAPQGDLSCVASAEVYDPITNKWTLISPMNTARQEFALLSYHGKLHAIGGFGENLQRLYSSEIYDPQNGEWTSGPPLDSEYYISAAVVI